MDSLGDGCALDMPLWQWIPSKPLLWLVQAPSPGTFVQATCPGTHSNYWTSLFWLHLYWTALFGLGTKSNYWTSLFWLHLYWTAFFGLGRHSFELHSFGWHCTLLVCTSTGLSCTLLVGTALF